jgi:predicted nucleic acid-binding protein
MARYLLDTNLLVGFVRGAPWAARAYSEFKLGDAETIVLTSDICRGELLSLAEQFGWGSGKREKMTEALNQYSSVGIEHASVQEAYAVIDNWTHGRSKSRPSGSVQPLSNARPMNQNDLWIAATAMALKADLLSADHDFDQLDGVFFRSHFISQSP